MNRQTKKKLKILNDASKILCVFFWNLIKETSISFYYMAKIFIPVVLWMFFVSLIEIESTWLGKMSQIFVLFGAGFKFFKGDE